jgi:uncharacterized protein YqeY
MSLKQQIDSDLKQAMLAGDKTLTTILRGLKSAILYAEVDKGSRVEGLSEPAIIEVLAKESKKRQESADLYAQGGNADRQHAELYEKKVIDAYLPAQLSDEQVNTLIDTAEGQLGKINQQNMGQIIGYVKQKAGPNANGATIANLVKQRITQ